jgi:hypothetical protein
MYIICIARVWSAHLSVECSSWAFGLHIDSCLRVGRQSADEPEKRSSGASSSEDNNAVKPSMFKSCMPCCRFLRETPESIMYSIYLSYTEKHQYSVAVKNREPRVGIR